MIRSPLDEVDDSEIVNILHTDGKSTDKRSGATTVMTKKNLKENSPNDLEESPIRGIYNTVVKCSENTKQNNGFHHTKDDSENIIVLNHVNSRTEKYGEGSTEFEVTKTSNTKVTSTLYPISEHVTEEEDAEIVHILRPPGSESSDVPVSKSKESLHSSQPVTRKSKRRSPTLSLTNKPTNGSPLMIGNMKSPLPPTGLKADKSPRNRSSSFGTSTDIPRTPKVNHRSESPMVSQPATSHTPPGSILVAKGSKLGKSADDNITSERDSTESKSDVGVSESSNKLAFQYPLLTTSSMFAIAEEEQQFYQFAFENNIDLNISNITEGSADQSSLGITKANQGSLTSPEPGTSCKTDSGGKSVIFRVVTPQTATTPRESNRGSIRFTSGFNGGQSPSNYFPFMKYGLNFNDKGDGEESSQYFHPPTPDIVKQVGLAPLASPSPTINTLSPIWDDAVIAVKGSGNPDTAVRSETEAKGSNTLSSKAKEFIPASYRQSMGPMSSSNTATPSGSWINSGLPSINYSNKFTGKEEVSGDPMFLPISSGPGASLGLPKSGGSFPAYSSVPSNVVWGAPTSADAPSWTSNPAMALRNPNVVPPKLSIPDNSISSTMGYYSQPPPPVPGYTSTASVGSLPTASSFPESKSGAQPAISRHSENIRLFTERKIAPSAAEVPSSYASNPAIESKKRSELVESPATKLKFKDFYKQLKAKEKESFEAAKEFGLKCSELLPEKIHWRVYLELADLAKRENRFSEARELYNLVNTSQPYASQGWLEHSKMEEECGELLRCQQILYAGLSYCNQNENILTRIIRHEERRNNLPAARAVLSRLQSMNIEKSWRVVLEGALLEARAGNIDIARKVFKYLMVHVPWYGPIYCEAYRIEEHYEQYETAVEIIERGLREIPRYGPLWFGAFRLYERLEMKQRTKDRIENARKETNNSFHRAIDSISKELIWKVHFEFAQKEERNFSRLLDIAARNKGMAIEARKESEYGLGRCRDAYVQSVVTCPLNLRWKCWLGSARTELLAGRLSCARILLNKALEEVPEKSLAQVLLECSRVEEYIGNVNEARNLLTTARNEAKQEWKVYLESVLVEMRANDINAAIEQACHALTIHTGTGRLWAVLIQLKYHTSPGNTSLHKSEDTATSSKLDSQLDVFQEALREVPKSGEVWCEGARIYLNPLLPIMSLQSAARFLNFAIQFTPQYGDSFIELMRHAMLVSLHYLYQHREREDVSALLNSKVELKKYFLNLNTSVVERKCVNADPNYGAMWFYCKGHPSDGALSILNVAKNILADELACYSDIYLCAYDKEKDGDISRTDAEILGEGADFCMGFSRLNKFYCNLSHQTDHQRYRMLFSSDQIVP